jgi:hypothetical protein
VGSDRLRWLDDAENCLSELKIKIWRQPQIIDKNGQVLKEARIFRISRVKE